MQDDGQTIESTGVRCAHESLGPTPRLTCDSPGWSSVDESGLCRATKGGVESPIIISSTSGVESYPSAAQPCKREPTESSSSLPTFTSSKRARLLSASSEEAAPAQVPTRERLPQERFESNSSSSDEEGDTQLAVGRGRSVARRGAAGYAGRGRGRGRGVGRGAHQPVQGGGDGNNTRPKRSKNFFITWQATCKYDVLKKTLWSQKPENAAFLSSICIANEWGIDNHGHCHALITTTKKWRLVPLAQKFVSLGCRRPDDVKVNKGNVKNSLKYITKEDGYAVVKGFDLDKTNINWKMMKYIRENESINWFDYVPKCVPVNYRKIFREWHGKWWADEIGQFDHDLAMEYGREDIVRSIHDTRKRGIYLWGTSGNGKTSTCKMAMHPSHYQLVETSNFPLTSYKDERDIFWDDASTDGIKNKLELIKQMCDGYSFPYEVKGGDIIRKRLQGRLYITSNYPPPNLPEFRRRFFIVHLRSTESDAEHSMDEG